MSPQERSAVARKFADWVSRDAAGTTQDFLNNFHRVISTRLASELCPEYSESNLARGYYRLAIAQTARTIVNRAWSFILHSNPQLPIVIICGGGPGSGKLTAVKDPLAALRKEIAAIYDTSNETIFNVRTIIEQLHARRIPAITTYVHRPLKDAAAATIIQATSEGLIPDAKLFATAHVNALNNFLSLVAHYKKKRELFRPLIIFNQANAKAAFTTSHRDLKQQRIAEAEALETFRQVWTELQDNQSPLHNLHRSTRLPPANRSRKSRKPPSLPLAIADAINQTLRKNLIEKERRIREISQTREAPSSTIETPPITLVHQRHSQDKRLVERTEVWRDRTAEGLQETLDREHPPRIAVKEKTTHPHEMEIDLIR